MIIFLICPVRTATGDQKERIKSYIDKLIAEGKTVYYPARDTQQDDPTGGYNICWDNKVAILLSDEVHIFWDKNSIGSIFDLGMAFALNKELVIVNSEDVELVGDKSFAHVIQYWSKLE